ncbi:uncharacterized protein LOC110006677 isoform X2 [Amborella trichopoda]|uniref:uncharacterized protein LOC110006677 isoform X2 n=1 Tax=Amborella trichopoda TaxID=13333 RepID=UPI0009BE9468|nr:uncharacterized protein LOC110006677 isoform X2 [Amborella trichopoda]|eukprot:XP_020518738.1 uncharacterized protein LOC110006677 isoform X2 [Amborella trichopoda]
MAAARIDFPKPEEYLTQLEEAKKKYDHIKYLNKIKSFSFSILSVFISTFSNLKLAEDGRDEQRIQSQANGIPVVWRPPQMGSLKLNGDGSSKRGGVRAGGGGILRDHFGEMPLDCTESRHSLLGEVYPFSLTNVHISRVSLSFYWWNNISFKLIPFLKSHLFLFLLSLIALSLLCYREEPLKDLSLNLYSASISPISLESWMPSCRESSYA